LLSINDRVEVLARELAERERKHSDAIKKARSNAADLHRLVASAIDRFNAVVGESTSYLQVSVSEPRIDDKHVHAVEFDLERGRHRAIVTVKTRGEVTLVGPFRTGKAEGPCRSFSIEAEEDLEDAIGDFLERFLEAAAAP
jgi:hypothetical protein